MFPLKRCYRFKKRLRLQSGLKETGGAFGNLSDFGFMMSFPLHHIRSTQAFLLCFLGFESPKSLVCFCLLMQVIKKFIFIKNLHIQVFINELLSEQGVLVPGCMRKEKSVVS